MKTFDHMSPKCCKGRRETSKEWSRLHCTRDHCSQCQGLDASFALACLRLYCKSKVFPARWMSTSSVQGKQSGRKERHFFLFVHTSLSRLWSTVWSRFRRVWSRPAGSATSLRWMFSETTEGISRRWSVRAEIPWSVKETAKGRSHAPRILPEKCMNDSRKKNQWSTGNSTVSRKSSNYVNKLYSVKPTRSIIRSSGMCLSARNTEKKKICLSVRFQRLF